MKSGAKYREQRKKEGKSGRKEGERKRERRVFLPPLTLSFPLAFPLWSLFFAPSPLPEGWNRPADPKKTRLWPQESGVGGGGIKTMTVLFKEAEQGSLFSHIQT